MTMFEYEYYAYVYINCSFMIYLSPENRVPIWYNWLLQLSAIHAVRDRMSRDCWPYC